ncbi:glycosyltransferase [Candidatus Accumulibacter phosphatis]|uniref:TPR/glycosyl transferase domain protein n=1 Tax=Candidatus Accumulibacter phosphatis TaxID=327160 RepID=A0A5S4EH13_9PROT|nr:glycosyltransferase [Candidatus Accumulibacter phosphatis]TMQ74572.1 TPR/glycosyl transferase domain protein [Candidatus Accumulibacter phosphatis]
MQYLSSYHFLSFIGFLAHAIIYSNFNVYLYCQMSKIGTAIDTFWVAREWLRLESSRFLPTKKRQKNDGQHVCLFAWALPPNSNAGVYRPLSFIRYGTELGWRFDCFQGEVPENSREHGEELLAHIPIGTALHVVAKSSREPSFLWSPEIDGGFKNALKNAGYAIERLRYDPPDVVIASGPPFYVFVAAYFVAKWFGVPLVLDYRDEWTECPFDFVSIGRHDQYWERRCLVSADAVLFTTQSHLDHQLSCFPELVKQRAYLVPNGWEPNDFAYDCGEHRKSTNFGSKIFNLAHIGSLGGHNLPHDFLGALEALLTDEPLWRERLVVHFVGRRSPEAANALNLFPFKDNLRIVGHVGKQEANRLMMEADCLLLIAVPNLARYLPGKLFDYVASLRPILVFGSPGEASSVVELLGNGLLCQPGSRDRLAECLKILSDSGGNLCTSVVDHWLSNHRRERLARTVFQIIDSLLICNKSSHK